MHKARHWKLNKPGQATCLLCPHRCLIPEGQAGRCGTRVLRADILRASGYGMLSGAHFDPVEKKPLYHFHPGIEVYSIGGWGCNLSCRFCQNWGISQQIGYSDRVVPPEEIIRASLSGRVSDNPVKAIAYTYNEPLINFEFVFDCAKTARDTGQNIKNILITNGFVNPEPAQELLPLIDAVNVDLKSMDPEFYKTYCAGKLEPILEFAIQAHAAGCHVEITNLIIPGLNDDDNAFLRLARWIKANLGETTPLHLSAYHPAYKLQNPPTPPATLQRAAKLCRSELPYVYLGNIARTDASSTFCPQCGVLQIERQGYQVWKRAINDNNLCSRCERPIDMIV